MLRLIGNILWFILGGFFMGLAWWFVGLIAFVTIVGIPWGRACFVIGGFSFWPFGREAVNRRALGGEEDIGTGPFGTVGNVIWLLLAGWWLALGHIISGVLDCITIIGIPFGIQHFKLAVISLWPIGVRVVPVDVAAARFGSK
ncbi:MAG: YccF domain-containing protein [Gammaproteobacteria bacterium]|nr:YccF domain-containing protein [Gammaproteobacteria bacterium]